MSPDIFSHYASRYDRTREEEFTIQEYLEICKRDPLAYASAAERMLILVDIEKLMTSREMALVDEAAA